MVRARAVAHPREWRESGYQEIQKPPQRYRIIDRKALAVLLAVDESNLALAQNEWIEAKLRRGELEREAQWSESLAADRRAFVEQVQERLGHRARYRQVEDWDGTSVLRDPCNRYASHSEPKIDVPT